LNKNLSNNPQEALRFYKTFTRFIESFMPKEKRFLSQHSNEFVQPHLLLAKRLNIA